MPSSTVKAARPLSPHLQIYKPQLTSGLSILHRMTGVFLSFGILVFVGWLTALAQGAAAYQTFLICAQSVPGQLVLLGLTGAFFFHLSCGIRHLFWSAGFFLDIHAAYKTGYIALAATVLLTAGVWFKVYGVFL